MSSYLTKQKIEDLKLVLTLSMAVNESCEINGTAQVLLFVRLITSTAPKEELLRLMSLKGQTGREDIANDTKEYMVKHHITLNKIVSISIVCRSEKGMFLF